MLCAVYRYHKGMGKVNGEHFHEAFGVDSVISVADLDGIGLQAGETDELTDIVHGTETNCHNTSKDGIVHLLKICYNKNGTIILYFCTK